MLRFFELITADAADGGDGHGLLGVKGLGFGTTDFERGLFATGCEAGGPNRGSSALKVWDFVEEFRFQAYWGSQQAQSKTGAKASRNPRMSLGTSPQVVITIDDLIPLRAARYQKAVILDSIQGFRCFRLRISLGA